MTLGPYALVLSYILSSTNYKDKDEKIFVYRGMRMSKKLFKDQYGHRTALNKSTGKFNDNLINTSDEDENSLIVLS